MACNDQMIGPCGGDGPSTTPFEKFVIAMGIIGTLVGIGSGIASALGAGEIIASIVAALGGVAASGALAGLAAVLAVFAVIAIFGFDRCQGDGGPTRCVSAVVEHIEESYNDVGQELFPFAGQHTRLDLVVKAVYWPYAGQQSATYVWCTDDSAFASVVVRAYYYTKAVCAAVSGAFAGAAVGGAAGIVGGALVAAAILGAAGCATVFLCLFALLLAAIIAAVAAIVGAFVGGQIGKAAAGGTDTAGATGGTTADHTAVAVGDLVSVTGPMEPRNHDEGANVFWWVGTTVLHGKVSADTTQPYTHCDVEDQLPTDACGLRDPTQPPASTPPPEPPR